MHLKTRVRRPVAWNALDAPLAPEMDASMWMSALMLFAFASRNRRHKSRNGCVEGTDIV